MSDSGASFGNPPPSASAGGPPQLQFPGTPGAQVDNAALIQSAVLLLIEALNSNLTSIINTLSNSPTFGGTITGNNLNLSGEEHFSAVDPIVALPGGGRPGSPVLSAQLNRLGTVANAADSVQLPAAAKGDCRFVANDGANAAQIFANGTDTIDGVAGVVGVPLTNPKRAWFVCMTAGQWVSMAAAVSS